VDAFAAATWYVVTVMVIWLAWTAARRVFPGDGRSERTMHALILIWTWIVLVSCGLGTFGALNAATLAFGVLLLAFATWFWCRVRIVRRPHTVESEAPRERWAGRCWYVTWTAIAATGIILVVHYGVLKFPDDWDTLMYHRPLIVLWLQTGSLYVPECAVWHVPGNNELWGLWWAAPFSGDFWVALMNVPGVVLLALGTYEVARLTGVRFVLRHATVIAVLGSSIVFQELTNAKNDVAVVGLFMTGLAYGIRYVRGQSVADLAFAGAALGLLAGIKYYALGYAGVGWLSLTTMSWRRKGRRGALTTAVLLGAIMLLPAAYWYGRNLTATGTPLYPLGYSEENASEVRLGPRRSAWKSSLLGNGRPDLWLQYVEAVLDEDGICQMAAVCAIPFSLLWLLGSSLRFAKQKKMRDASALRLGLALAVIGAWLNFAVTPFTVTSDRELDSSFLVVRFSQVPLAISVVILSLLLSDTSQWLEEHVGNRLLRPTLSCALPGCFTIGAFATFTAQAIGWLQAEWAVVGLVCLNLCLIGLIVGQLSAPGDRFLEAVRRVAFSGALIGGMGTFVFSSVRLSQWWHGHFASYYDQRFQTQAYSELEALKHPLPRIASLHFRYYPLFGSRRQFRVYRPLRVMSLDFLFAYLVTKRIDIVVVAHRGNRTELDTSRRLSEWMKEHPGVFERINSGGFFHVYRIDRDLLRNYVRAKGDVFVRNEPADG